MSDHCPTCGSNRRDMNRSPHASEHGWHQWVRDRATYVCPNPWHSYRCATCSVPVPFPGINELMMTADGRTVSFCANGHLQPDEATEATEPSTE